MNPRISAVAGAALVALTLAGCSAQEAPERAADDEQHLNTGESQTTEEPTEQPADEPEPSQPARVGESLPELDATGFRLPFHLQGQVMVRTPWDVLPQHREGVFLAPGEQGGALIFTAVDAEGTVLWAAERPPSCTGFALTTTSAGRDLAVLTDVAAGTGSESLASTTASAVDLRTGEEVWGPVDVGGPHVGPGLTFAAPADAPMGAGGPKVVLDPDTGQVAVSEAGDDVRVLGDFGGTILVVEEGDLVARSADGQEENWRVDVSEHGWTASDLAPVAGAGNNSDLALLSVGDDSRAVLNLADGSVLAEDVSDVATDETTGTRVVVEESDVLAYDGEQNELWAYGQAEPATITGIGGVMVYLRSGDAVRVHNVLTGEVAEAYDPDGEGEILVPAVIAVNGASVVIGSEGYHLVTLTPADS